MIFHQARGISREILIGKGRTVITSGSEAAVVLNAIRRLILFLLVAVMLGTAADLMLLDHHEGLWQLAPLLLIGLGLLAVTACVVAGSAQAVRLLRVVMVLFVCAGPLGMALHYNGNLEFQKEIDPGLSGWPLFVKIVTAKAPPALAPAVMVQMGLLGLLYTYQHPARARRTTVERQGAS